MEEQATRTMAAWAEAERHGDAAALLRLLADDFRAVGPRGFVLTRDAWIARHRDGDLQYSNFAWDEVSTRRYSDTVIAIGRQRQDGTYRDHAIAGQFRAALVLVREQSGLRLASLQLSPIAGG